MRIPTETHKLVALSTVVAVALNNVAASALVVAAYGFDLEMFRNPGAVVGRGAGAADLLRLAAFIDLVGYLAFVPVVLYLHRNGRSLLTVGGVAAFLVGAIGAAILGSAGPWVIAAAASADGGPSAQIAMGALENIVFVGLWGTLELALLGGWVVSSAWYARQESRGLALLGYVAGAGALAYGVRSGLTGQTPVALSNPLDLLILGATGLLPLWFAWLAWRVWRQPPAL